MRYLKWLAILFIVTLCGAIYYAYPLLHIGMGYAAKMACSCHYFQGRSLEDIHQADLNFSLLPQATFTVDNEAQKVTAKLWGIISQEAFWTGNGCTLQADLDEPTPTIATHRNSSSQPMAVNDTALTVKQLEELKLAGDFAFEPIEGGGTRALLVLQDSQLIYERYAPGFNPKTPLLGWSMTKSITNALVGLAVKNNVLQLRDKALFKEWANDDRAAITLTDLLHMNSGLQWNEAYGNVSDATTMLYTEPSMGNYAKQMPTAHPPNEAWSYSSGTTNILSILLQERLGDLYESYLYDSLFTKIGMHTARIEVDQAGTFVGSSYGWATAQDWARFGQLYLQNGRWGNEQILPEGWVNFSREAAVGSDGIYGAQIWLRTQDAQSAPTDIFMFRGFQDQRIVMIPSLSLVIVRLGMNEDQTFPLNDYLSKVLSVLTGDE